MNEALSSVAWVAAIVVVVAAALVALHRAMRPKELHARSATALRELEPQGGRHRFHVRLFEVVALASACTAGVGALLMFASSTSPHAGISVVGGGSLLVAVWWAWRRGALRAVEAEPQTSLLADATSAASTDPRSR